MNAGIIVDAPLLDVRFKGGRKLGTVEEDFASTLSNGDTFFFAGLVLEVEKTHGTDLFVRATTKSARIPTYMGTRMAMSTNLADRVRIFLDDRSQWPRFPDDVREWLEVQEYRSMLPRPDQLLVETFPHEHRHYMVAYSFEGWNAHQSLGMLITRRMESAGPAAAGLRLQRLCPGLLRPRSDRGSGLALLARHIGERVRRLGAGLEPAEERLPRGGGDRRAGRAPPSGQAQDRAGRSPSRPT